MRRAPRSAPGSAGPRAARRLLLVVGVVLGGCASGAGAAPALDPVEAARRAGVPGASARAVRPVPTAPGEANEAGMEVLGVPDPAWTLRRLDGTTFTLGQLRGRPVFVNLWATWCPPCVAELASIGRLARAVETTGAHFVLASHEAPETVREFVRRQRPALEPVLEETLAPAAFGELVLPTTAVLDTRGRMVLLHRGAADWNTPEVRALLRALAGGPTGPGPEPGLSLESRPEGWSLTFETPPGWYVYAVADGPGAAIGPVGRPLRLSWEPGGDAAEATPDAAPESLDTAWGPVRVHRDRVRFALAPPPQGSRALRVRWALCRADLCVPGERRLRLTPPGSPEPPRRSRPLAPPSRSSRR